MYTIFFYNFDISLVIRACAYFSFVFVLVNFRGVFSLYVYILCDSFFNHFPTLRKPRFARGFHGTIDIKENFLNILRV